MRCLVVEDDNEIATIVKQGLGELQGDVEVESNGRRASERALTNNFDIIVLDLMLPEMDGYTFAKTLREKEVNTPFLILSALRELDDRLKGLSMGGDDYLTKPFAMAELQIRVKNLLKRSQKTSEGTQLVFQDLKLNRLNRDVIRAGRQIDLQERLAAGQTCRTINVKKGQFLAPWDMKNVAAKIASTGNDNLLLCERGVSFGYNTLVSDMRSLPIMAQTGYPVIFDATHSVQQPGGQGTTSGGQREFVPVLARAAMAVGVAGVFMETHENPHCAPSDGPNMVPVHQLKGLLETMMSIDKIAKANPITL